MNGPRKKILLVKPVLPYPPDQGTRVVSFDLIQTLSREYDVTVLARLLDRAEEAHARELERYCSRVVTVMAPNRKSTWHRVAYKVGFMTRSWLGRRSLKSLYECPGDFVRRARRLAGDDFDCVVLEYWQLFPLLDVFPDASTVLLTHDVEMLVNRQNALLERNLFRKLSKVRTWLLEQREEMAAYQKARRILTLTDRDAAAVRKIREMGARNSGAAVRDEDVAVLPVGLDVKAYAEPDTGRRAAEVLFMGELRASFNRDALEYFVRSVFPHLDDVAGLRVTVVGGQLPPHLVFFGRDPRVEITGRVPDVRPYLARAACFVVPLRFGGGLRIRILEAMMAGIPTVCSSVAIAGMDFRPESDYLLADTASDTAGQIKRLLADPGLGAIIARNARSRVVERYSSSVQSGRVLELFRSLMSCD